MTPLGIMIGMLLTSMLQGATVNLAEAIALGIGSGSFIYLAFHELSDEHASKATPNVQKLLLFLLGMGTMAWLAASV